MAKKRKKKTVKKKKKTAAVARKTAKAGKGTRAARKVAKKKKKKAAPVGKVYLTAREREILRLVSLGCTVSEAAAILKVAPSTADNHKARLMAKLGTDKAALLARLAIKMGVSSMRDRLTLAEKRKSGRKQDGWN